MNDLISEHEHGFHGKAASAKVEEILERGAQQVHDEYIVVLFLAIPSVNRTTNKAIKNL